MRSFKIIIFCLAFLLVGNFAQAYYNPGKPAGFVNDYTKTLSVENKIILENKLTKFNKDSSNEITVVIIQSLKGDTIENFSTKLFEEWKIGKNKKDNGVLLLIAMDDHKIRIEPGYGLEGALPDATCYRIITDILTPAFKNSDYYGGINIALDKIISATKGEYQPDPNISPSMSANNPLREITGSSNFFPFLLFFGLWILSALRRYLAKSKAWWEGGLIGGIAGLVIALIFFRSVLGFILWILILGGGGLLFDYLVSRILPPPGKGGQGGGIWFLGGGGNSGGFGGGGFGGFGGGGSGGGGASGGW